MTKTDKIKVKEYVRKKPAAKKDEPAKLDPINKPIDIGTKIVSRDQPRRKPGEGVTILGRHGGGIQRVPR
jgi:hypothetical protein